jgi:hypothetical protein
MTKPKQTTDWTRLRQAQLARSTTETRIALVAFELGLSAKELEQFYFVRRSDAKLRHFNHKAFAEKYGVDLYWLWDGELYRHPRGLTIRERAPRDAA